MFPNLNIILLVDLKTLRITNGHMYIYIIKFFFYTIYLDFPVSSSWDINIGTTHILEYLSPQWFGQPDTMLQNNIFRGRCKIPYAHCYLSLQLAWSPPCNKTNRWDKTRFHVHAFLQSQQFSRLSEYKQQQQELKQEPSAIDLNHNGFA